MPVIEPECRICMEKCWTTSQSCIPKCTPCGHVFGSDCIIRAINAGSWECCPVCRTPLRGFLIRLFLDEQGRRTVIRCIICKQTTMSVPLASSCGHIFCNLCASERSPLQCPAHQLEMTASSLVKLHCGDPTSGRRTPGLLKTPLPTLISNTSSIKLPYSSCRSSQIASSMSVASLSKSGPFKNRKGSSVSIFELARWEDFRQLERHLKENSSRHYINARDIQGMAALHHAANNMRVKNVELLLSYGAYINIADDNNWTPLMYAARNNHTKMVKLLLEKGADPYIENNRQQTARDMATGISTRVILAERIYHLTMTPRAAQSHQQTKRDELLTVPNKPRRLNTLLAYDMPLTSRPPSPHVEILISRPVLVSIPTILDMNDGQSPLLPALSPSLSVSALSPVLPPVVRRTHLMYHQTHLVSNKTGLFLA